VEAELQSPSGIRKLRPAKVLLPAGHSSTIRFYLVPMRISLTCSLRRCRESVQRSKPVVSSRDLLPPAFQATSSDSRQVQTAPILGDPAQRLRQVPRPRRSGRFGWRGRLPQAIAQGRPPASALLASSPAHPRGSKVAAIAAGAPLSGQPATASAEQVDGQGAVPAGDAPSQHVRQSQVTACSTRRTRAFTATIGGAHSRCNAQHVGGQCTSSHQPEVMSPRRVQRPIALAPVAGRASREAWVLERLGESGSLSSVRAVPAHDEPGPQAITGAAGRFRGRGQSMTVSKPPDPPAWSARAGRAEVLQFGCGGEARGQDTGQWARAAARRPAGAWRGLPQTAGRRRATEVTRLADRSTHHASSPELQAGQW